VRLGGRGVPRYWVTQSPGTPDPERTDARVPRLQVTPPRKRRVGDGACAVRDADRPGLALNLPRNRRGRRRRRLAGCDHRPGVRPCFPVSVARGTSSLLLALNAARETPSTARGSFAVLPRHWTSRTQLVYVAKVSPRAVAPNSRWEIRGSGECSVQAALGLAAPGAGPAVTAPACFLQEEAGAFGRRPVRCLLPPCSAALNVLTISFGCCLVRGTSA
jgi:hypothetical protein